MLPFTDIDFFIFAALYVAFIWLLKVTGFKKYYSVLTFIVTLIYIVFYFKFTAVVLSYFFISFLYIRFLSHIINHKLISSLVLALPMVFVKIQFNPSLFYFAGLSFVTFRAIQTCIDYKKETPLNVVHYFNFLYFIPSLFIGPLDRYKRFAENCEQGFESINEINVIHGLEEFMKGVLYKFVIAELISRYWLNHDAFNSLTAIQIWNDVYAYPLYVFFDFAGYSSMAIGLAYLVGINLPFNFNSPFKAINPPDFWQRWHASLTNWLTDYFFKPLYQWLCQRKKLKKYPLTKQNIAIFFTLFVMGIWNGFEPNFIWSGIIYAIYSVLHNTYVIESRKKDKDVFFGTINPRLVRYISIVMMFNLACIALYVFSGRSF